MWVGFALSGLLAVLGIVMLTGRGAFLIAGYNTMPKEERKLYDGPALARFMGKILLVLALGSSLWSFSELGAGLDWLFSLGLVLFLGAVAFALVYTSGKRFMLK